jgi:putative transposase
MKIDPHKFHRRSMRLKGYDYSLPGAYFVTIVTYKRECLFGEVVSDVMQLNRFGNITVEAWLDLPVHYPQVTQEAFVVMPNHVHGIIIINDSRGRSETYPYKNVSYGLSEIVRAFKSFSARRINQLRNMPEVAVWQRFYYDHIIRGDQELRNIWEYIQTNAQQWQEDPLHVSTSSTK